MIKTINIEQNVIKSKDENVVTCILCGGSHGDNTLCQMPWRAGSMKFSKKTKQFVYHLISSYAKYDADECTYDLELEDIPDLEVEKFAYYIYLDNPDFASESTGADNNRYDRVMMPALLNYLKNSSDRDEAIEFMNSWRKGVTHHAENVMRELISNELNHYDDDLAA